MQTEKPVELKSSDFTSIRNAFLYYDIMFELINELNIITYPTFCNHINDLRNHRTTEAIVMHADQDGHLPKWSDAHVLPRSDFPFYTAANFTREKTVKTSFNYWSGMSNPFWPGKIPTLMQSRLL